MIIEFNIGYVSDYVDITVLCASLDVACMITLQNTNSYTRHLYMHAYIQNINIQTNIR